ncbi:purine and uridine phosphorylase [Colletotrichum zoysiae]|uniref:Purine and uridine phosphorylase n=1 Tax=Colletotrichum zoysiae TaxID=1216348 RepID=A0AAD9HCJ6_9PEZI|nr:purine and uridine phosphorylase [Colletotrichum zoysiae]
MAETAMKSELGNGAELGHPPPVSGLKERLHEHYTVGWVCALPKEQTAAMAMLDQRHPDLPKPSTDNNAYTLGSIGKHMVVIACLPKGQIGNNSAATVATRMVSTFPAVRFCFMVGIGGGVPSKVRLGDVVVSTPTGQHPGVVQWDFGKAAGGGRFERTGALNNPPGFILTALAKLESVHEMEGSKIPEFLEDLRRKWPRLAPKYLRSDSLEDVLFKADYDHIVRKPGDDMDEDDEEDEDDETCRFCDRAQTRKRKPRDMLVHYGLIASGNQVVKDGMFRDNLNKSLGGKVLCIEMEAAGLITSFPCLVIRGICDYADSHKNKQWQEHAAAVAATFAKELLGYIEPQEVEEQRVAKEALQELRKAIAATESNMERLRNHIQSEEDMNALEWLASFDYGPQQSDLLSKCHPGTGQWLFESGEFTKWENSPSGTTLLCTGIPGAGKTIITSLVINHLHTRFGDVPEVGIAYIYCNFRRHYQQQYADMLASLIKQLCQTQPTLPGAVRALYERHRKQRTRPSLEELSDALQAVLLMYARSYILVDALDECQSLDGTRSAILSHLFRIQNNSATHLFFTSRHIPDVLKHFRDCERLEVRAMDQDVLSYVDGHLPRILEAVPETPGLMEEIREKILKLADGMFLLAHLYLESLRDKTSATELRAVIGTAACRHDNISKDDKRQHTLYQAYDVAMARIAEQSAGFRDLERPLSTMELQHALAIREDDTDLDYGNMRKIEVILSVCAGLVTVDQESDVVGLIHFTTQEYFDANETREKYFPDAHSHIAAACVSYLSLNALQSLDGFYDWQIWRESQNLHLYLLRYAATTWGHHTRKGQVISPAVYRFLANDVNIRVAFELISFSPGLPPMGGEREKRWTGLHAAAFFDLQDVVKALVKTGHQPYADDCTKFSPLFIASSKGYETIVRLLLESGAEVDDEKDVWGRTPLRIASQLGHEGVVKRAKTGIWVCASYSLNEEPMRKRETKSDERRCIMPQPGATKLFVSFSSTWEPI